MIKANSVIALTVNSNYPWVLAVVPISTTLGGPDIISWFRRRWMCICLVLYVFGTLLGYIMTRVRITETLDRPWPHIYISRDIYRPLGCVQIRRPHARSKVCTWRNVRIVRGRNTATIYQHALSVINFSTVVELQLDLHDKLLTLINACFHFEAI